MSRTVNDIMRLQATCRRCGACCRQLLPEADIVDVIRQPAIAERGREKSKGGNGEVLPIDERVWTMWRPGGCAFLADDNTCSIYLTRPRECVAFVPGSDKCLQARAAEASSSIGIRQPAVADAMAGPPKPRRRRVDN